MSNSATCARAVPAQARTQATSRRPRDAARSVAPAASARDPGAAHRALRGCRGRGAARASCRVSASNCIVGSARIARCCGASVAQPARPTTERTAKRIAAPFGRRHGPTRRLLHPLASRGHLRLILLKSRRPDRPRTSARSCTSRPRRPRGSWPRCARGCGCAARRGSPPPARATYRSSRLRTNESGFGRTLSPPAKRPTNGHTGQLGAR